MARFSMNRNPVYQVDCQVESRGKNVAASKRRVRWQWGFSHLESIEKGLHGNDCRGEEHEVMLVWSLMSGKQLVVADGQEVFFGCASGNWLLSDGKFETSWTIPGGHELKVIAYAAPPLFPTPGFRQFDLLIDGLSFWDMPKIYELGSPSKVPQLEDAYAFAQRTNMAPRHSSLARLEGNGNNAIERQSAQRTRSESHLALPPPVDLLSEPLASEHTDLLSAPSPTSVAGFLESSVEVSYRSSYTETREDALVPYYKQAPSTPSTVSSNSSYMSAEIPTTQTKMQFDPYSASSGALVVYGSHPNPYGSHTPIYGY